MKIYRTLLLLGSILLATSASFAQIGEPRNDWTFGAGGGVAINQVTFSPSVNQSWAVGPMGGLVVRYTSERYFKMVCSLQAEVNYARLGWKEDIVLANGTLSKNTDNPETYSRDFHYLQLPLLARLGFGREYRGLLGYLVLGPQIGWMIADKERHSEYWNPTDRINGRNKQYGLPVNSRFDYGITGGLGLELSTSAGHFLVEGRYYFGLANVFGASKADAFGRSANGTIMAKITYLLPNGKKGMK